MMDDEIPPRDVVLRSIDVLIAKTRLRKLASNLSVAGALCAAFRAGDNFGFHMGSDESQCTCQWSPNVNGEAYRGSTRCAQDVLDDPEDWNTDCLHCEGYGCSSCNPLVGGEG